MTKEQQFYIALGRFLKGFPELLESIEDKEEPECHPIHKVNAISCSFHKASWEEKPKEDCKHDWWFNHKMMFVFCSKCDEKVPAKFIETPKPSVPKKIETKGLVAIETQKINEILEYLDNLSE